MSRGEVISSNKLQPDNSSISDRRLSSRSSSRRSEANAVGSSAVGASSASFEDGSTTVQTSASNHMLPLLERNSLLLEKKSKLEKKLNQMEKDIEDLGKPGVSRQTMAEARDIFVTAAQSMASSLSNTHVCFKKY
jgi:hypothetical protein